MAQKGIQRRNKQKHNQFLVMFLNHNFHVISSSHCKRDGEQHFSFNNVSWIGSCGDISYGFTCFCYFATVVRLLFLSCCLHFFVVLFSFLLIYMQLSCKLWEVLSLLAVISPVVKETTSTCLCWHVGCYLFCVQQSQKNTVGTVTRAYLY